MANSNNIQFQQYGQFNPTAQNQMAQFLPQPQGNVYLINSSNEITLVPVGAVGVSVAICMNEGIVYFKTMQNGNPMLLRYKLTSLDIPAPQQEQGPPTNQSNNVNKEELLTILKNYDDRIRGLEQIIVKPNPQQVEKGGTKEWQL